MTINTIAPTTLTNLLVTDISSPRSTQANNTSVSAYVELQGSTGALVFSRMTTAQRDALNPTDSMAIFNTTDNEFQMWRNAQWNNVSISLSFEPSVYAGSTANLNAVYDNGIIGIGATLSNAGPLIAFAIDGVSPPLNSRILVKNQTSNLENGIYDLTQVGSGAVPWILTRSSNYNSPSEIEPGDFVIIDNGTALSATAWVQTNTITVVGVSSIQFSRFGNTGTVTSVATGTGLTGGPITTTGTVSLANTIVTPGSYTLSNITVDQQGRLTAAASGTAVTSVATGTGLSGGPITTTGTIILADTAVTPGAYTSANITIDQQGRITTAASGGSSLPFIEIPAQNALFIGTNAGNSHATSLRNTGMGDGSVLHVLAGGDDNTAYGYRSSRDLTVGLQNCSYGAGSGASNVSGNSNVSMGFNALFSNSIQDSNIAFGDSALKALNDTLGISNQNIFIGQHAGQAILDGNSSIGIGASVMSTSTTSNIDVIAIGRLAFNAINNVTGSIAIGQQSGTLMTTGNGSVFLGASSGALRAVYNSCTFVGSSSDANASGLTNAGAFGNGTTISVSNGINLGNGCLVGINQAIPSYALDIAPVGNKCLLKLGNATLLPSFFSSGSHTYTYTFTSTDATPTTRIILNVGFNSSCMLEATINGCDSTQADFTGGTITAGLFRAAGNTALVGVTYNKIVSTTGDFNLSVVNPDDITLTVNGVAGLTYTWILTVKFSKN